MRRLIALILVLLVIFTGCSSGVTQADYDAVVKERDDLKTENSEITAENKQLDNTNKKLLKEKKELETAAKEKETLAVAVNEKESVALGNASEYFDFLTVSMESLSEAMQGFSSQADNLTSNPSLILDADWTAEIMRITGTIKLICTNLVNYDVNLVPSGYEEIHALVVLSANDYLLGMDYFTTGLTNFDPAALDKAVQYITTGTEHILSASNLLLLK